MARITTIQHPGNEMIVPENQRNGWMQQSMTAPEQVVVTKEVEKVIYVDNPVEVIKEVEVVKYVTVESVKEVEVEKLVYVDKPIEIIKEVQVEVIKEVPVIIEIPKITVREKVPNWAILVMGIQLVLIVTLLLI